MTKASEHIQMREAIRGLLQELEDAGIDTSDHPARKFVLSEDLVAFLDSTKPVDWDDLFARQAGKP